VLLPLTDVDGEDFARPTDEDRRRHTLDRRQALVFGVMEMLGEDSEDASSTS
jgi:hypothetical protein